MNGKWWKSIAVVLALFLLLLTSCIDEYYYDCEVDDIACEETMEAELYGECDEDDEDCWVEDLYSLWGDDVLTADDCYEDEVYDEEDQWCYPAYDDEACQGDECGSLEEELWGLFDTIIGVAFGGGDFSEIGDGAIITYDIQGNQIVNPVPNEDIPDNLLAYQEDTAKHQEIWARVIRLIPDQERRLFTQFVIFTDGPEEIMASVNPVTETDLSAWILAMDIQDAADDDELNYTLIHEYGHVMTLNNRQVDSSVDFGSCDLYFPGEGCTISGSYINAFYQQFWADVFAELGISDEMDMEEGMMEDYYYEHEDEFVTDYAATNPGEDIAESFTHFVMQTKPNGDTIAEQKILFFYNYPELVALRTEIAARLISRMRRR